MIVLIALAVFIAYRVLLVIVSPTRPCRYCRGHGVKNIKRMKFCRRCHGSGRVTRFGAQLLNRSATQGLRYTQNRDDR